MGAYSLDYVDYNNGRRACTKVLYKFLQRTAVRLYRCGFLGSTFALSALYYLLGSQKECERLIASSVHRHEPGAVRS